VTLFGRDWTDERIEQWIGGLLRVGVLAAAAVAAVGGAAFLLHYGGTVEHHATFHGVAPGLETVHGVVTGAVQLRSRWVVQLGLVLLIGTPIARVTAIVLGILLYSLLGPGVG
jgi:uncharacterized membrane protein